MYEAAGKDFPINVRLLDVPPTEFLPDVGNADAIRRLSEELGVRQDVVIERITALKEGNVRGPDAGWDYEIFYGTQAGAIYDAAAKHGITPNIMVPLVRSAENLEVIFNIIDGSCGGKKWNRGAMLETLEATASTPENAVNARKIAEMVDFISFGTNDLTEELLGITRNNVTQIERWQNAYRVPQTQNPFETVVHTSGIDKEGPDAQKLDVVHRVENTMRATMAIYNEINRERNAMNIRDGGHRTIVSTHICGEQACDRKTVMLVQELQLTAISVAPNEVDITAGTIEAGRAAGLDQSKQRTLMEEARKVQLVALEAVAKEVAPTTPDKSNAHVIFIADSAVRRHLLQVMGGGKERQDKVGVTTVATVAEAQEKITEIQSRNGRVVHIFTDDMLEGKSGSKFIDEIVAGNVPGFTVKNVTLMDDGALEKAHEYNGARVLSEDVMANRGAISGIISEAAANIEGPPAATAAAQLPDKSKLHIVFVDDSPVDRRLFKGMHAEKFADKITFSEASSVDEAKNKVAAIQAAGGRVVHIFTDELMPGTGGKEFIDQVAANMVPGVTVENMTLRTAQAPDQLPSHHNGAGVISKSVAAGYNPINAVNKIINQVIDGIAQESSTSAPVSGKFQRLLEEGGKSGGMSVAGDGKIEPPKPKGSWTDAV